MLGCGLPGGEQGFNMARVVAVLLGHDELPGTTVNRYCSSSLQTTRMAFHAIKAGEGDVFISAGRRVREPARQGQQRHLAGHAEPAFADAAGADRGPGRRRRRRLARPARGRRAARHLHRDGPDRGERGRSCAASPARAGRVRRAVAEPGGEGPRQRLLAARDHPGDPAGRHRGQRRRRAAARHHAGEGRRAEAGVPRRTAR